MFGSVFSSCLWFSSCFVVLPGVCKKQSGFCRPIPRELFRLHSRGFISWRGSEIRTGFCFGFPGNDGPNTWAGYLGQFVLILFFFFSEMIIVFFFKSPEKKKRRRTGGWSRGGFGAPSARVFGRVSPARKTCSNRKRATRVCDRRTRPLNQATMWN